MDGCKCCLRSFEHAPDCHVPEVARLRAQLHESEAENKFHRKERTQFLAFQESMSKDLFGGWAGNHKENVELKAACAKAMEELKAARDVLDTLEDKAGWLIARTDSYVHIYNTDTRDAVHGAQEAITRIDAFLAALEGKGE